MTDNKLSIDPDSKVAFHLATPQPNTQNIQNSQWPKENGNITTDPDADSKEDNINKLIKKLYYSLITALGLLIFAGILAVWTYHDSDDNSLLILLTILTFAVAVHVVFYFDKRNIFIDPSSYDYSKLSRKFAHIGWASAIMVAIVIIAYYEIRISVTNYLVDDPASHIGTLEAAKYLTANGLAIFILLHLSSFSCGMSYIYALYKAFQIHQYYAKLN